MFDIGVNLTSSQFDKDRADVVSRAQNVGVHGLLVTGTSVQESEQALACATEYKNCWATAGVHPHDASTWSETVAERIYRLAGQDKVVAVGECGLDFNRNFSSPLDQERAFSAQLAIAAECELPVFLHCREAHDCFMVLLKPWLNKLPAVVLHCFTGTRQEADECLAHGMYLGVTGWVCDERRGLALRELLPVIPASQLFLETDAPYLLPRDLLPKPRSRRNEPCLLPHIFQQVARWRNEDPNELEAATDNNVRRVFNLSF